MGTWGRAILSDDVARDTHDWFIRAYNSGRDRAQITEELIAASSEQIADTDDGPVFWLALARAQWDTGAVDQTLLDRVEEIVRSGEGLARWKDAGAKQLAKRRAVLADFLEAIRVPNPRPRKRKPPRLHRAIFKPGDCLAVQLADSSYGAAVVLAAEDGYDNHGPNLVGTLHFRSHEKPGPEVFEQRRWLTLSHHSWSEDPHINWFLCKDFKKFAHLFELVGTTSIRASDPSSANSIARWDDIPLQVELQFQWEKEHD